MKEINEIESVSEEIERILVKDYQDKVRVFKKILWFSDLKSRLEAYYPGTIFMLTISGSNRMVGSQDELYFAYKDVPEGEKDLMLDLTLTRKRKADDADNQEFEYTMSPQMLFHHTGRWSEAELERFKIGINTYGWGKWRRVAEVIETRSAKQVCKFSESQQARRFRDTDSITGAWVNLAAGLDRVSKGLEEK